MHWSPLWMFWWRCQRLLRLLLAVLSHVPSGVIEKIYSEDAFAVIAVKLRTPCMQARRVTLLLPILPLPYFTFQMWTWSHLLLYSSVIYFHYISQCVFHSPQSDLVQKKRNNFLLTSKDHPHGYICNTFVQTHRVYSTRNDLKKKNNGENASLQQVAQEM